MTFVKIAWNLIAGFGLLNSNIPTFCLADVSLIFVDVDRFYCLY